MNLNQFSDLVIDWDMSPEDAVILYLEWGNNDFKGKHQPVRSKADFSNYFVVDTWSGDPIVRLVRRNSDAATDLAEFPLPAGLRKKFKEEHGNLKGVYEPTDEIKQWLKAQLEN